MALNPDKYFSLQNVNSYYKNQTSHLNCSGNFTDEIFPPNFQSLMSVDKQGNLIDQYIDQFDIDSIPHENIEWRRASTIFPPGYKVIDKIEIDDIKQGGLGDCYFLSAISALAEFPCLIKHILRTSKVNSSGYYEVVMYIDSVWQIVVIDDYFPVFKGTKDLAFTRTNGNEIWVIILEKAWAKVNRGYLNICGGEPSDAFTALTSFPTLTFEHRDMKPEKLWEKIIESEENNDVMAACSDGDEKKLQRVGLVSGHAYSVLSARLAHYKGKEIRLVKIRNPWGDTEWLGDWSDKSGMWTNELKTIFELKDSNDGSFWMSFEDYLKYYVCTNVCMILYDEKVKYFKIKGNQLDRPNVFNLHLKEDSRITFSVERKYWRYNRELRNKLHPISLVYAKYDVSTNQLSTVSGYFEEDCTVDYYKHLKAGHYVVWINYAHQVCDPPKLDELNFRITSKADYYASFKGYDDNFTLVKEMIMAGCKELYKDEISKQKVFLAIEHYYKQTGIGYLFATNRGNGKLIFNLDYSTVLGYKILGNSGVKESVGINPEGCTINIGMLRSYYNEHNFDVSYSTSSKSKDGVGSQHIGDVSNLLGDLNSSKAEYDYQFEVVHKSNDPKHEHVKEKTIMPTGMSNPNDNVIYIKATEDVLLGKPRPNNDDVRDVQPIGMSNPNDNVRDVRITGMSNPNDNVIYIEATEDRLLGKPRPNNDDVRYVQPIGMSNPNDNVRYVQPIGMSNPNDNVRDVRIAGMINPKDYVNNFQPTNNVLNNFRNQDEFIILQTKCPDIFDKILQLPKVSNDNQLIWKQVNFGRNYYIGQINSNYEIEGIGAYVRYNDMFVCQWKYSKANGYGRIYDGNNLVYDGTFYNDNYDGKGKLKLNNGDYYEGQFKDGNIDGSGYYKFSNGESYQGNFIYNKINGRAIHTDGNGVRTERDFQNGAKVIQGVL